MFVVYFMCSSNAFCIPVICISEYFKALVYKNIVYHKIGNSINKNTNAYRQTIPNIFIFPQIKEHNAHNSIKKEKSIIALKPTVVVFFMMIFMKRPQKAMHDVLMRKPSHKFHKTKSADKNKYPV